MLPTCPPSSGFHQASQRRPAPFFFYRNLNQGVITMPQPTAEHPHYLGDHIDYVFPPRGPIACERKLIEALAAALEAAEKVLTVHQAKSDCPCDCWICRHAAWVAMTIEIAHGTIDGELADPPSRRRMDELLGRGRRAEL
jgi:hypothetical protein